MKICEKSNGGLVQMLATKVIENTFLTFLHQIENTESEISKETHLQPLQCTGFCVLWFKTKIQHL